MGNPRSTLWYYFSQLYDDKVSYYKFTLTPEVTLAIKHKAGELKTTQSLLLDCMIRSSALDKALKLYQEKNFTPTERTVDKSTKRYGQTKGSVGFNLTATSNKLLDSYASKLNESRSEVIELAVRAEGIQAAAEFLNKLLIKNNLR